MDKGGPAFPLAYEIDFGPDGKVRHADSGMTLRDYFAGQVAMGDAASDEGWSIKVPSETLEMRAALYYRIADAMLKARNSDA